MFLLQNSNSRFSLGSMQIVTGMWSLQNCHIGFNLTKQVLYQIVKIVDYFHNICATIVPECLLGCCRQQGPYLHSIVDHTSSPVTFRIIFRRINGSRDAASSWAPALVQFHDISQYCPQQRDLAIRQQRSINSLSNTLSHIIVYRNVHIYIINNEQNRETI